MLIIKRSEKAETLISLLQAYYEKVAESVGVFEEKQGVVLHHSKLDSALFNVVCGYKEPRNVLNIAALLEEAKAFGQSFLWLTHDANVHLQQYLLNQGLDRREPIYGLLYDLSAKLPSFDSHPAVKLIEVMSEEQFYEWCHVFSESYGLDFETACEYFKAGLGKDRVYQLFMAQVYQKTVACSAMYIEDKLGLLIWDTVLPMYRRQGVGSMMVLSRMKMAQEIGCEQVYALGMDAHMALLKGLGFKSFGKFQVLCYDKDTDEADDG